MPGCYVLAAKFLSSNELFLSISNGLILLLDLHTQEVKKIFANKVAIVDCLKIISPTQLMTAGIDSKVRIWGIRSEKLQAKFEIHKFATQQLIVFNQTLYSYGGHDMKLVKFDIVTRETDCWINLKSHVTALKLLKSRSKKDKLISDDSLEDSAPRRLDTTESELLKETMIAAAFHDFDVVLYDLDLN